MKPSLYIQISSRKSDNPIAGALRVVGNTFGAEVVDQLVHGEVEADIAIVNSVESALHVLSETERTAVVVVGFQRNELAEQRAFASRHADRVTATSYVNADGEKSIVVVLAEQIAAKSTPTVTPGAGPFEETD
jgi:hypothetical protein